MTFQQYIDNPLGRKNAVFSQRDTFKQIYTQKYDAVLLREAGKIKFFLYYDKEKDTFYTHIKIPSEVVPKFYYDVVIKFYTKDNGIRASASLKDYDVQFFSNDPAFVFTYERVFHKLGMFVEECKPKASKIALKKDPKEKNPYEIPGYVKSIYFAFLFIKQSNLFSKALYSQVGEKYNQKLMLSKIENTDKVIEERQIKGEEIAKQLSKEKKATRNREISNAKARQAELSHKKGYMGVTKITDTTKTVKPVNRVKTVRSLAKPFKK